MRPLRMRATVGSSAVTEGRCGSSLRGWTKRASSDSKSPPSRKERERDGAPAAQVPPLRLSFPLGATCSGRDDSVGDFGEFFQGVGVFEGEFGDRGAAEGLEMGAAGQFPAHVVSDGAHVGSGGDAGAETDAVGVDCEDFEFLDLDLHRLAASTSFCLRASL